MPTETEDFVDEEFLTDAEESVENTSSAEYEERETFELSDNETNKDAEPQELIEPNRQAVLDQKGGEPSDWQLEYKGDSGYHFDGQDVRDPEGNVWTNEDTALHQEMVAQWKEGGSAIFFLPDYREQMEDREILYVTQLILSEKGGVTYEIHKHETIYPKDEGVVEKKEEYTEALAGLRLDTTEDFRDANELESGAETPMSIEAAEGLGMNDSEPVEVADEISPQEVIPTIETESVESVANDPIAEMPLMADNVDSAEKSDAPDPWLVELLNFDALDPVEPHDDAVGESDVPQITNRDEAETIDLRAVLGSEATAELDIAPDVTALEHSEVEAVHEPESVITSESLTTVVEIADPISTVEHRVDMQEMNQDAKVDSSSRTEITSDGSIAEQPISILVAEQGLEPTSNHSRSEPLEAKEIEDNAETSASSDFSLVEAFPNTFEVNVASDAVAESQEPVQNMILAEQLETRTDVQEVQVEMGKDFSETETVMQPVDSFESLEQVKEPISDAVNPVEPVLNELVMDRSAISELSGALPEAVAIKDPEIQVDAKIFAPTITASSETHVDSVSENFHESIPAENAFGGNSIASETVELQNAPTALHEIVDAKIRETTPAAIEHLSNKDESMQSIQLEERSPNAVSGANGSEPAPLQSAETILRALGIPLSVPRAVQSPEFSGSRGIPGMPRGIVPLRDTRAGTTRFRSSVRSHSKDGVTLEMAA